MDDHPSLVVRTDLAPDPGTTGEVVARLAHLSDLHVLDAASPMRFEWIETLADDPRWRPLLHMHRPQESLVPWALAQHVDEIRGDGSFDVVISTGDNIDNAQRNELDVYLALVAGGTARLAATGGPQDARERPGALGGGPWPYWSPSGAIDDRWKPFGYPVVDDLVERTEAPLHSAGLGVPWTSLPGNHDLFCQGTSAVNDELRRVATGGRKALLPPPGFVPDDPLTLFVDRPEVFVGAGERPVGADPERRPIELTEWIAAHAMAGALGWAGTTPTGRADTVVRLGEVTIVMLDTNHPHADYQGSVGRFQLRWLEEQLDDADREGRLVVLASHHGPDTLVNERGHDPERVLAAPMLEVVHRHPCVVLWLTGHRHVHRVTPRPGDAGGFWEITTASIIDWPCERRSIELVRHPGGTIEVRTRVQAHRAIEGSLAWWHRDLAERFGGSTIRQAMAGSPLDRDVRLLVGR